ncbi:MAG: glycosyltransferase family 39 protein [Anaerolineae bacterium]|nr:glycosyltransferase family 39 protein [Anaerolineae bacterium]
MTDYPNLSEWALKLSQQANGFALWFGMSTITALLVVWARRRFPLATRLGGMGAYVGGLAIAGRDYLPALIPAFVLGVVAYKWLPHARRLKPIQALLMGALVARLPGLWSEALWYDETFTAGLARLEFPHMMDVIRADVHPPLWYMVEWVTVRLLGSSEAALRFPSLLCGLLVVYLIYRLALALSQPQATALVAAGLVSILPAALHYSNDARGYSLLAAAVLLMTIAILEGRPLWFILAGVVALYTHNLAWFYFGVIGLTALWIFPNERPMWMGAVLGAGLAGGLWLPTTLQQTKDIMDGFWLQPINLGDLLRSLIIGTVYTKIPEGLLLPVTGGVIGLSVLSAIFALRWLLSRGGRVYLAMVLGAPLLIALVSAFWHNVFIERAVLASVLGMSIIWARLLTLGYKGDKRAVAGAVAPMLLLCFALYYHPAMSRFDARNLAKACQNTDVAFTTTTAAGFITHYYLPHVVVWSEANDLNQQLPPEAKTALGWQQSSFDQLRGRVCLIDTETALNRADERDYVESILAQHPHRTQTIYRNNTYTVQVHIIQVGV